LSVSLQLLDSVIVGKSLHYTTNQAVDAKASCIS